MGWLSNRIDRSEIRAGDHIYNYRVPFLYSHHGIYVGDGKVVHFTRCVTSPETGEISIFSCSVVPGCGFVQPKSGVMLSCLDCFLLNGDLYRFDYGVSPAAFMAKMRGGTCTTAESDPPETVIHRAMYLLQIGFGDYDISQNNCEDFALYCKTGLITVESLGFGTSGQASTVIGAPLAALISSSVKLVMPSPIVVAIATAGIYCMCRYAADIGVRSDVVKVAVEDLVVNLVWPKSKQALEAEIGR